MIWKPHVTVAAIAVQQDRFLMVEEEINQKMVLNQPAGHLEDNETLINAVIRETREETAWTFVPKYLTGIYQWKHVGQQRTFLRFCFFGDAIHHDNQAELDPDIHQALWLTLDEIRADSVTLRSPLVLSCIEDYLAGKCFPLELLTSLET